MGMGQDADALMVKIDETTPTSVILTGVSVGLDLNATGTPMNSPITYAWTASSASVSVSPSDESTTTATFSATGVYTITVTASQEGEVDATDEIEVTVNKAPAITSAATATATVGSAFTFTLAASGYPTPSIAVTGTLPPGLGYTPGTKIISGTPTASGSFPLTVTATNGVGSDDTKPLTITVSPANLAPTITSAATATATVNAAFSFTVTATGYPAPTITATGLPAWLTYNAGSHVLSGTAPATAGEFEIAVAASNGVSPAASQTLKIKVNPANQAPVVTSPATATATVGSSFTLTLTATGYPAPTIAVTGTLPTGLTYTPGTKVISGTPTASGSFPLTVTATNGIGEDDAKPLTITVNPANQAPVITSPASKSGTVGIAFSFQVVATGTPSPTISVNALDLPPGLTFNSSTKIIGGTPTEAGSYSVGVTATNGVSPSASQDLEISISAQTSAPTFTTHPQSQSKAVGSTATFTAAATGGAPISYQWYKSGSIILGETATTYTTPAVTVGDNGAKYHVTATNASGTTKSDTAVLTVVQPPKFAAGTVWPTGGTVGIPVTTVNLTATGSPPPTFSATGLPPGITVEAGGKYSGTPTAAGSFAVTFFAANGVLPKDSALKTVVINPVAVAPSISVPPAGVSVTSPAVASFSVTAAGTAPLTYEWYRNAETLPINGATMKDYSFATTPGNNGDTYKVKVINSEGSVTSPAATLTVLFKPQITAQPQPQSVTAPAIATFSVTASGNPATLSYQWKKDGVNITGATAATYNLTTSETDDNTKYSVVVSNTAGSTESNQAVLRVNAGLSKPKITSGPASITVTKPNPATFTITMTGNPTPTDIKWQRGTTTLAGQTQTSYTLSPTGENDNGAVFRAIVTNSQGSDTSAYASLNVQYAPIISTQPTDATVNDGQSAGLSVVAKGNPAAITYQWWRNIGNGESAIANATNSAYNTGVVSMADSGRKYNVRLSNGIGNNVISNTVTLHVKPVAPVVTSQPPSVTVNEGQSATFSLSVSGTTPMTFQWRKGAKETPDNMVDIPGATQPTYTISSASYADSGAYIDCQITNRVSRAWTGKPRLHVKRVIAPPVITNSNLNLSGTVGSPISFTITATGTAPFTFGASPLPSGLSINSSTGVISGTPTGTGTVAVTLSARNSAGTANKTLNLMVGDIPVAPTINSPLAAKTNVSFFFSYTITASGATPMTFSATGLPGWMTLNPATGVLSGTAAQVDTLAIVMTATNSLGSNSKTLVVTIAPTPSAPKFTLDLPPSLTVRDTDTLELIARASGEPTPTYTWQLFDSAGSVRTLSQTSASYRIPNPTTAAAGIYQVSASNGISPNAFSQRCTVYVIETPKPPKITQSPAPQTVLVGQSVSLAVTASGGRPPYLYQWQKDLSDLAGANATVYSIDSAQLSDAGSYRCRVMNADGSLSDANTFAFSDTARLVVNLPKVDIPKTNYPDTVFTTSLSVSLHTDTAGTTIRYTLDGQDPSERSTVIDTAGRIEITRTTVLKAFATKDGLKPSDILTRNYTYAPDGTVALAAPQPADSVFPGGILKVTFSASPSSAKIWYTVDGSAPTENGPTSRLYNPDSGVSIAATTIIKARAFFPSLLPSAVVTKKYILIAPTPKVATPAIAPPARKFTAANVALLLSTTTDSAVIWYTLDGSDPTDSPTRLRATGIFSIERTTTVKAIAERNGWKPSEVLTATYQRIPGPLITTPSGDADFDTSLTVTLSVAPEGTPIYYTTDGSDPLDENLNKSISTFTYKNPIVLRSSTFLRAVAMGEDKIPSEAIYRFYNLSSSTVLLPPAAEPSSRSFRDSIKVHMRASRSNQAIYYTLNGEEPDPATASIYRNDTVVIDTTTTLRAITFQEGFTTSAQMVQNYTLIPDTPTATPKGNIYGGTQYVTLNNRSKKVAIIYTLNGEDPVEGKAIEYRRGDTIQIATTTTLKARAIASPHASPILEAVYTIIDDSTILLLPNTTYVIPNSSLSFYHTGEPPSLIELNFISSDSIAAPGFADISFGMSIKPVRTSGGPSVLPKVVFNKTFSEKRALYRMLPDGTVNFLSNSESIGILEAGLYFLARDTMPVKVDFLGDAITDEDSTEISFSVRDNVSNLLYDFIRSDAPDNGISRAAAKSGQTLTFRLKSPLGDLQPLTASLSISDGTFTVRIPEGANQTLVLAQSLDSARSGDKVNIGVAKANYWDMISLPVHPITPMTLKQFWDANPGPTLKSVYSYDSQRSGLVEIKDEDPLLPWKGYWMAAKPGLDQVHLPSMQTSPLEQGQIRVQISHGWNLIGLPIPKKMYWPIPRILTSSYSQSFIKGPIGFSPAKNQYLASDSLEAWRGYWVFSYVNQDTTVLLSQVPVVTLQTASAKFSANSLVQLAFSASTGEAVEIGAMPGAQDGLGIEDEPALPTLSQDQGWLVSVREKQKLRMEWVNYQPGSLMTWTLVQNLPDSRNSSGESSDPSLSVTRMALPQGYAGALVSKRRRIHYPLVEGIPMPTAESPTDSLNVWIAPEGLLKQALKGYSAGPPPFSSSLWNQPGRRGLKLDLPAAATIQWILCDARGRIIAGDSFRRAEGRHWVSLDTPRQPAGILFLRAEIRGQNFRRSLSYRFPALP